MHEVSQVTRGLAARSRRTGTVDLDSSMALLKKTTLTRTTHTWHATKVRHAVSRGGMRSGDVARESGGQRCCEVRWCRKGAQRSTNLNDSWPAVSQICSLICLPSIVIIRAPNSTPIVRSCTARRGRPQQSQGVLDTAYTHRTKSK
jgi:hypothetical protein